MSLPKLLVIITLLLFGAIGLASLFTRPSSPEVLQQSEGPIEIVLSEERAFPLVPAAPVQQQMDTPLVNDVPQVAVELPFANRIEEFFNKQDPKLPIVETITYKSHVAWQKGRPAWLSDYAAHYHTSRHFIARSLNGKADYLKQELSEGDKFNVLRNDKSFEFTLIVDTSRCKMWFYYVDLDDNSKVLIKSYDVGLGRVDASKASGLLTPLGKYSLGDRIATYKPKVTGSYQGQKVEMVTVFGTRWIPFEKELGGCTAPAKGLGIHGTPWERNSPESILDQKGGIGKYESDGCIRLATPDMEELFSIIISRPCTIEIVRDFSLSSVAKKGQGG